MSLYNTFKTSSSLEKEGIVLDYGPNMDLPEVDGKHPHMGIRVARAGGANEAYNRRMESKVKPYRRQIQNETIERKLLEDIVMEVFVETVVLGWENVTNADKQPMSFSKENCIKLFTDLPDLFKDVQEQASKSILFRQEIRENDAKN